jgi:hypothetical protein
MTATTETVSCSPSQEETRSFVQQCADKLPDGPCVAQQFFVRRDIENFVRLLKTVLRQRFHPDSVSVILEGNGFVSVTIR